MREYRNRICSAVLAAVCVIGTALIPSRAVHAEDVVDPIAVQKQAAYDAVPETNGLENWPQGPHVYACKFGDCYGDEQRGDFIREKNKR